MTHDEIFKQLVCEVERHGFRVLNEGVDLPNGLLGRVYYDLKEIVIYSTNRTLQIVILAHELGHLDSPTPKGEETGQRKYEAKASVWALNYLADIEFKDLSFAHKRYQESLDKGSYSGQRQTLPKLKRGAHVCESAV